MTIVNEVFRKVGMDFNNIVNSETGEIVMPEDRNLSHAVEVVIGQKEVSYDNYAYIDIDALTVLNDMLNKADMGRISIMIKMVKSIYNALYSKDGKPHKRATLSEEIGFDAVQGRRFIKKLYDKGIIGFLDVKIDGVKHVHIIMNPVITRRAKNISEETLMLFQRFPFTQVLTKTAGIKSGSLNVIKRKKSKNEV